MVKRWTHKGYNKGKRESYVKKTNYEKEERRQGIKTPIVGFPWGSKLTGYSEVLPRFYLTPFMKKTRRQNQLRH